MHMRINSPLMKFLSLLFAFLEEAGSAEQTEIRAYLLLSLSSVKCTVHSNIGTFEVSNE